MLSQVLRVSHNWLPLQVSLHKWGGILYSCLQKVYNIKLSCRCFITYSCVHCYAAKDWFNSTPLENIHLFATYIFSSNLAIINVNLTISTYTRIMNHKLGSKHGPCSEPNWCGFVQYKWAQWHGKSSTVKEILWYLP